MKRKAVIAIVNYEGKVLVGKKKKDSKGYLAGDWHILGGKVEEGETYRSALMRGIYEEAGINELNLIIGRYISSHISPTMKREARWYECFSSTDRIVAGSDLEDVIWVDKKEVINKCSEKSVELWPKEIKDYFNIS